MKCALARGGLVAWTASGGRVSRMARFQQTPRRLAMGDEAFVQDEAGLGLDRAGASAPDPGTAALLRLGGAVAIGSSVACLEWSGVYLVGCVTSGAETQRSADGI